MAYHRKETVLKKLALNEYAGYKHFHNSKFAGHKDRRL